MRISAFFASNDNSSIRDYVFHLLNEYQTQTDKIRLEFIDPDKSPELARKNKVTHYPMVVFSCGNSLSRINVSDIIEQAEYSFSSAILKVTGSKQKKVFFLQGHAEANIESRGSNGYSLVVEGLLQDLYRIGTINLLETESVPGDCALLIIAAPRKTFDEKEVQAVQDYLFRGGQALFLIDPESQAEVGSMVLHWGITIMKGMIVEPKFHIGDSKYIPFVTAERNLFGLPLTYFPGAAGIEVRKDRVKSEGDMGIISLITTTDNAWLERAYQPKSEPEFQKDIDAMGRFSIGVMVAASPLAEEKGERLKDQFL